MELGATMEFRVRRGGSSWRRRPPFIVGGQFQPLPTTQPAAHGTTAPQARYYRTGMRYYYGGLRYYREHGTGQARQKGAPTGRGRSADAVLPRPRAVLLQGRHGPGLVGTEVKNYTRAYLR